MVNPFISIITPTYNRAKELDALFESLSNQSIKKDKFELIISDDGSSDSTKEVVEKWVMKAEYRIKYFKQYNQGPGAARNIGLENSVGTLICFIDSDCEAHEDWLSNIVYEYNKSGFDACGGPDGAKKDFSALQKAIDYSMTSFFTTGGMRGHSANMIAKFSPRTHNMCITRSMYKNIGGFGNLRHGQDIEFSNRIRQAGGKISFIENALDYHRRRSSIKQFAKQVFNWGVARVNLGKIDNNMLELIHFLPAFSLFVVFGTLTFTFYGGWNYFIVLVVLMIPLLLLSINGSIKTKNHKVFSLLMIIIPIQIFGYGIGFIQAFIRRFIFGGQETVGFKKNYYK